MLTGVRVNSYARRHSVATRRFRTLSCVSAFLCVFLCILYSWDCQIQDDEMGGVCSTHVSEENAYKTAARATEGKRNTEDLVVVGVILRSM